MLGIYGALAGALVGSEKDTAEHQSWLSLDDITRQEAAAMDVQGDSLGDVRNLTYRGPGSEDVSASVSSSRGLAAMLAEMSRTGGLPSQSDIDTSEGLAAKLFGRRRTALDQSFEEQSKQAAQLSAQLGRPVNDPVLQNMLRGGFMKEQALLDKDQSAFAADYSMKLPDRRLGFASQQSDVLGNLARQAMNNRAALLGMGSNILSAERGFRLNTGRTFSTSESGGGLKGAFSGAMIGAGLGQDIANKFAMGAGGGMAPAPFTGGASTYGPSANGAQYGSFLAGGYGV